MDQVSLTMVSPTDIQAVTRLLTGLGDTLRLLEMDSCEVPADALSEIILACPAVRVTLREQMGSPADAVTALGENANKVLVGLRILSAPDRRAMSNLLYVGNS